MNTSTAHKALVRLLFCCCLLSTLPARAAGQEITWQKHVAILKHHARIVRYYTFEQMRVAKPTVESQAGEKLPLKYEGREPIRLDKGPWKNAPAIGLDANCLQGKPFAVDDHGFTVEIRFRKRGQGSQLGNGRKNGMLIADGTGYWDGFRISSNQPNGQLRFEIGRPKPNSAIGVTASDVVPDNVWHHLAATWNGREMRIYLNGVLLQAAPFTGNYSPSGRLLKIGYADSGIGSLKLDVCEIAVFNTALPPTELMQHACLVAEPTGTVRQSIRNATEAIVRGDWSEAARHWKSLASDTSTVDAIRTVAKLAWARTLQRQGKTSRSIQLYASIADDQRASNTTRQIALRMCVPPDLNGLVPIASRRIYEHLVALKQLAPDQRRWTRMCLAERCMQDGDPGAARRQYELILKSPNLNAGQRWNLRLQVANSWLAAKDYKTARAAYTELAQASAATEAMRTIALLAVAHSFAREHQYAAAATAFHNIANQDGAPRHLRQEASDREREMKRLDSGQAARDPSTNRMPLPALPRPAITCYVAPDGNDDSPGTIKRPFASLARARDAIRKFRSKRPLPQGGVAIVVRGGIYPVAETFQLNKNDSGTKDAPIVYQAYPGEHPRMVGGSLLRNFRTVTDPKVRNRLPAESRDHVLQIDLKNAGVTDLGSLATRGYGRSGYPTDPWVDLYVDGQPMQLARWPNDGWLKIGKVYQGRFRQKDADKPGQFEYSGDRPRRWNQADDIWLFGAWGRLWEGQYVKVAAIDLAKRLIMTRDRTHYGFNEGYPYYFLNLLEELDSPGEWFLDRTTGIAYVYPPDHSAPIEAWFPTLAKPFVVMQDVSHVQLRGLTFEYGRAEGVVVRGGENVLLAGCTLCRLGTNGVIVQGGTNHGLLGCDIHTVGAGGIRMVGGDFKTLTPGRHYVENCHIHDFSRVDRVYAPAIHLDGVGNRISHNLMHHSPHHALRLEGFEHIVEFNEVHSVVYEYDDQAGLDIYGSPIYRGNVFRYNFWHHIGSGYDVAGQAGIRLDDFISDILIYGNIFYKCAGGHFGAVQIHGGKNNIVDNNLFIDCKAALSFSPWGEPRWRARLAEPRTRASMTRYGIDITSPPFSTRYPDLLHLQDDPDRNFVWRNLIIDCPQRSMRDRGANQWVDNHAMIGDPGFVDRRPRNFSFPDNSPIYDQFSFRPIPFQEIGLYKDNNRASWPVTHDVSDRFVAKSKR